MIQEKLEKSRISEEKELAGVQVGSTPILDTKKLKV
jgi:hypothetical protein